MRIRAGTALTVTCISQACAGAGRDVEVLPAPHAVATAPSDSPRDAGAEDAHPDYERLLTRTHATFGLAEARGIDANRLDEVLEAIANGFETCAQSAQREGWLERAALRLIVAVDAHGQVSGVDARLDDPQRGGKAALVCLVAPVKALNFGAREGTVRRGLALEVLFGPSAAPAP